MSSVVSAYPTVRSPGASQHANVLADRVERGARALADFASALTESEWQIRIPKDGRTVGVLVHHVASVYLLAIKLALTLAGGEPVKGMTMDNVDEMNARQADENEGVTKGATLDLLRRNSTAAALIIRWLSDDDLAQAAPVSFYSDAPLSCQFMLEDQTIRRCYHHLVRLREALKRPSVAWAP